jgi:hypothetical protein
MCPIVPIVVYFSFADLRIIVLSLLVVELHI